MGWATVLPVIKETIPEKARLPAEASIPGYPLNPMDEASLAVVVYGPDGKRYGSPAAARAAGVTNYTMSPPAPAAPAYTQQYIPGYPAPSAPTDDNGNLVPQKYGDPIYSQGDRNSPSRLIGKVGMIPVVSGSSREGNIQVTWQDDPSYTKSPQLIAFQKRIASGEVQGAEGGKGREYTSYDPATNTVTFYDTQGNITQQGQRTASGGGLFGSAAETLTGLGKTIADSPLLETAITVIAASQGVPPEITAAFLGANKTSQTGGNLEKGLETLVLSYGAGQGLSNGIDLNAAQAAAATGGGDAAIVDAALGGAGAAPVALTPAAIESGLGTAGYGVNAAATQSGLFTNPAVIGSGALVGGSLGSSALGGGSLAESTGGLLSGTGAAATPSVYEAVASGMSPGALGATTAATGGLTAAQLAAASGTVGAGSALEGLATLGNTAALTNLLSQGSSIGSTLSNLLPSSSTISSFLPSLITGGLQGLGAANTAEKAREAAQIQAAAQVEAARIAADAAKFRPVGVTTRFGTSNFTTDAQGNVIGAGYTASPEIKAYQDRLSALAAQGLTGAEGAQAAYAPLTAGAQSLFNLGQGYLQQTPEQQAAAYIAKQQALLAPGQEQQLAQLQAKLQAQGRGGLSVAQGGNLAATSPELAAYYNALAQSNLQLAAQGQQAGQQQAQFGAGLLGAGSDLMGKYYAGQTAAYNPFATAIDTSSGLESLAQIPMTLGTQIGAKTTASAAEAGRLLGQGMINSAATQAPANAFSYSGNLFSQAANNPQLQAAILKAFST